jgi:hypothetical protein
VIYDSQEGGEPTNEKGTIGLLAVLYGLFEYSSSSNYSLNTNVIGAGATYNSIPVPFDGPDPENIDMSTSKKAIFIVDTLPPVISDVALFGNKSITTNTLDRSHDDTLAISFNADESGEYLIIFDSNQDGEFNESNDILLAGSVAPGLQSIYWMGGNDTFLLSDGHYPLKFNVRDEFANWLSEPFTAITVIIKNSDLDGDGHLDISDDLPSDPTQWFDNDGDGYGDNPEGNDADLFPQDPTQWFDSDGDGYGDNPLGTNPDRFPEEETQWMDTDGDGYGDNVSGENGDAFPEDETQWLDSDGDGYGENLSGNKPDAFPKNTLEWEDSDGDGYGDNAADAFPDDPDEWLDEDGDGFGDNSDFLPGVNNWLMFFIIGVTVVIVLVGFYFFRGQKKAERPFDPGVSSTYAAPAAAPVTAPTQPQQPAPAAEKPRPAPPKKKAPPRPEPKKEAPPAKPAKKEEEPPPPPPPPPEDK